MKTSSLTKKPCVLVALLTFALPAISPAASTSWNGGTGTQEWATGSNWLSGTAPGALGTTNNTDIATFNTATTGTAVTIDTGRNIQSLLFGSSSGAYTIGSAGANGGPALHVTSGGSITLSSGILSTITVNAPLVIDPTTSGGAAVYSLINNASTTATGSTALTTPKLKVAGNISGGTSSTTTLTLSGTVGTRNADSSANAILQANTISGIISDGGATNGLSIIVNATSNPPDSNNINAWNLTGLNTYTGTTTVNGNSTLYFNTIGNIGVDSSLGRSGNIIVSGFLIYTGAATTTNRTIIGAGGNIYNNGTGTLTLTGDLTINGGSAIVLRGNNTIEITGLISGVGSSVTKTNGNIVYLSNNANSFTGNVNLSAGTIAINSIANSGVASGLGAGTTINMGQNQSSDNIGRLLFNGASGGSTNRTIIINGGSSNTSAANAVAIIENSVAGQTLTLDGSIRGTGTVATYFNALELAGAGNGVVNGIIGGLSGTGGSTTANNLKLSKNGTGTWTLTGANIYYGMTYVNAGILNIRNSAALGGTAGGATSTGSTTPVAGTTEGGTVVASGATLQLQNNITVGAEALTLSGTGATGQSGALVNVSGDNTFGGALTLAANTTIASDSGTLRLTNTTAVVGSGGARALTLAGAGDGTLAAGLTTGQISTLTKTGTGNWTLSGTSTYTGTTTVSGGILSISGSLANTATTVQSGGTFNMLGTTGTGAVSIQSGGTLSGTGTIGGAVTIANGGILAAGDATTVSSTGTLTINNTLILNALSSLRYDLGTANDLVTVNGALTLDGVLTITQGAGFTANTYRLINYTGTLTNNGLAVQSIAGWDYSVSTATANQVNLIVAATGGTYWDGTNEGVGAGDANVVNGGDGIWTNGTNNWTTSNGSANSDWDSDPYAVAIFAGTTGGTVQVAGSMKVAGLQFAKNYTLADGGGSIFMDYGGISEFRVDSGVTAIISASITGSAGINKTGYGTLVISATAGSNNYTGTTQVSSGTLKIGAANTLPVAGVITVGSSSAFVGNLDLSDFSQQVAGLKVESDNTTETNVITIGSGNMLDVVGNVAVGMVNTVPSSTVTTLAQVTGAGTLRVTGTTMDVGIQTTVTNDNTPAYSTTNLDLTTLAGFTTNVTNFRVGYGHFATATARLSNTSNIITATNLLVGHSAGFNPGNAASLVLGTGVNEIYTDLIQIGISKSLTSEIKFASQTTGSLGTLLLRGKTTAADGPAITIGSTEGTVTGYNTIGLLDLRGHVVDAVATTVTLGKRDDLGTGGSAIGTLRFDAGTFTVRDLILGLRSSTGTGNAQGVLEIGGGTFTVNNSFVLATLSGATGSTTGTVTLTGGTLVVNTAITEGGGASATTTNTVSTITVNGGTLDMTGHAIGTATNSINNLNLQSGVLKDTGEINGGGAISKTTTGTLVMMGNNAYSGATSIDGGTLLVSNSFGTNSGTGSGTVTAKTTTTLGGNGSMAGNVILQSGSTLAPGGNAYSITNNISGVNTNVGTLVITGSLNANSGSTIAVQLATNGTHGLTATYDGVTGRLTSVTGTSTDGGNDRIVINGAFTLDSASAIQVAFASGYAPTVQDVFDLIDWSGLIPLSYYGDATGTRTGGTTDNAAYLLDLPDITAYNSAWLWDVSQFGSTGVIAIIPEPSRAMLLAAGFLVVFHRRRRLKLAC